MRYFQKYFQNLSILAGLCLGLALFSSALLMSSAAMAKNAMLATNAEPRPEKVTPLHPFFTSDQKQTRNPASTWPADLEPFFILSEPQEREPASVSKSRASKKSRSKQAQKNQVKGSADAGTRRSRLPSAVSAGFEVRVKHEKLTSMIWVAQRGDKFDLLYSNSEGSRASMSLSREVFRQLQEEALSIKPVNASISSCPNSVMQLHAIEPGKPEKTVTACVTAKTNSAEQMRQLGHKLAMFVGARQL